MPVRISVKSDYLRAERALNDLARVQLPFATAAALTDTAMQARAEITAALPHIFDRPVAFTLNAVGFKPATKTFLQSEVFVKDIQARYLLKEETGGTRTPADNSRNPGHAFSLPSKIPLDAYGNIPNGAVAKLGDLSRAVATAKQLAGLSERALRTATRRRDALASKVAGKGVGQGSVAYLKGTGPHGDGPGGFFVRLPDDKIMRLTSFGAVAHYAPIFRFRERVEMVAGRTFRVALMKRLREARQTAR